jgi:hypothetical protein
MNCARSNNTHLEMVKYLFNKNHNIIKWMNKNCAYECLMLGNFFGDQYITSSVQIGNRNFLALPISRPTDATCDRFLFSIYMCTILHVSSVKRSSSGVPHRTYSLQFLCLCLSTALSCKNLSYKTVPQTDTNTETGDCMYGEGLLMVSAWHSKHTELFTYR